MKKVLATLLALGMVFSLAACGGAFGPDSVKREDFGLVRKDGGAKMTIGMTKSEVEKILGEFSLDRGNQYRLGDGLTLAFRDVDLSAGRASPVELEEENYILVQISWRVEEDNETAYKTIRGVTGQTKRDDVLKTYGETYNLANGTNRTDLGYRYDFKEKEFFVPLNEGEQESLDEINIGDDLWLTFDFDGESGKVSQIYCADALYAKILQ